MNNGAGMAGLVVGIATLRGGDVPRGVAYIAAGAALTSAGIATLRGSAVLLGVAFIGAGAALVGAGIAALRSGVLVGMALIGLGAADIGAGVGRLHRTDTPLRARAWWQRLTNAPDDNSGGRRSDASTTDIPSN